MLKQHSELRIFFRKAGAFKCAANSLAPAIRMILAYLRSLGGLAIRTYNLCVVGWGKVAQAFAALLQRKQQELETRYGIACRLTGVASRRLGWLVDPQGFLPGCDFPDARKAANLRDWLRA